MILTDQSQLSADEMAEVAAVIAASTAADHGSPVSEATLLRVRFPDRYQQVRHVVAREAGLVVGYGVLIPTEGPRPMVGEVAVHPRERGHGVGHEVVGRLLSLAGNAGLALWAHGRHAPAAALARSMGFDRQRCLLHMRRSLTTGLSDAPLPAGYRVRTFRPGVDDAAFLVANAAAFKDLPDQGGWDEADLTARLAEPWFDPAGFFLVEATSQPRPSDPQPRPLAGFHWTKLHPPQPLGEIYVLAVTPPHQGRGLAAPLALLGLRHLQDMGANTAMLYVDEANITAVRLYQQLGFSVWDVDVLYARDPA